MSEKKTSMSDWVFGVLYTAGFFSVAITNIAMLAAKVTTDAAHVPLWLIIAVVTWSYLFIAIGIGMTVAMARHGVR